MFKMRACLKNIESELFFKCICTHVQAREHLQYEKPSDNVFERINLAVFLHMFACTRMGKMYSMICLREFFFQYMHIQKLEHQHCRHTENLRKKIHRKTHLYKEDDVISHHNLVVVLHAGESGTDLGFIKRRWAALVDALH